MRIRQALHFLQANRWRVATISLVLLLPCFWHRRIEAGDLASHTYNAWLAQLIARGQAPGLYVVRRWNNILFDLALFRLGNLLGLAAAEKIVVSACVLIFFWGAFAFIAAATQRLPWFLAPAIAMITYGWTFHMGFMNYYLSLGLVFFAAALFCRGRGQDWIAAVALAGITLLAHPMGFILLAGMVVYIKAAERLPGWLRWAWFGLALLLVLAAHYYVLRLPTEYWQTHTFYLMNGADQVAVFGDRYVKLAWVVLIFGSLCFLYGLVREWTTPHSHCSFRTPLEVWAILLFTAAMIPEVIYLPQYAGPFALIISRLTSLTAVLGLCVLGSVQPRKWHLAGLSLCAAVFFTWLYQDTGVLNRMEKQAEDLVRGLPYGRRVTETIWAPPDSRIFFINHFVDRACIGRCFTYSNYEPSSGQFRVRVSPGSPIVTDAAEASQAMEAGEYVVQPQDLPMTQIYQCDEKDLAKLCARELAAGEPNGRIGYRPSKD